MKFPEPFFVGFSFSGAMLADFLFLICAVVSGIISIIMFFHWRKYSLSNGALALTEVVYISVATLLLLVAFFSI